MKAEFAYRIHDKKGNATGGYIRVFLDIKEYDEEYNDTHTKLLPLVAKKYGIDKSYLQSISLEEYYTEMPYEKGV